MASRQAVLTKLANLTAESLEQTGVTWGDLAIAGAGRRITMPLPPLFTDETLSGVPLQKFLDVKVGCSIEDFVAAYEGFIASHIALPGSLGDVHRGLAQDLGLPNRDAKMLFAPVGAGRPSQRPRDRIMLVHNFAALAVYNFDAVLTSTPNSLIAEIPGALHPLKFGSHCGAVITNYGSGTVPCCVMLLHPRELLELARSRGTKVRQPTLAALLWAWLGDEGTAAKHPEKEALRLALQILYWRSSSLSFATLRGAVCETASPGAWATALSLAERFYETETAYKDLFNIFVPNLLTRYEFVRVFGDRPRRGGRPNPQRRKLWAITLQYLGKKYNQGAKKDVIEE